MEMEMKNGTEEKDMDSTGWDEELAQMYEDSIVDIKEGQILKGKVVQIGEKDVLIDVGYKSEGTIYKSELSDPEELKVGDELDVLLEAKENDTGMVVLSHEKAKRFKTWETIAEKNSEGDIIQGKVFKKVRGGFMVDIGMQAFLPASLSVMQDFGGADNILGKKLDFTIVKINVPRKNIVLSRKEIVDEKRRGEKQAILEDLNKGDVVKGLVKNITDFGAFVDIGGGITGLLHITDMSWGRIGHPSEVVKVGDDIQVKVLDFDKESIKVSLGLKQSMANPWEGIEAKYPENSTVKGTVVNIMPYGVFVEIEKGIEGLIHISEFSWSKKFNHPNEKFKLGDTVEAMILKIDVDSHKLSLGIKQLDKDPWDGVQGTYNVGDTVKGTVNTITDYGAFIELESGIEGLVHVSDLSWTKRISHPKEILQRDDVVEAIILSVDESNRRIALGLKQLEKDPWDEIVAKYNPGTECNGTITNITNFGMFVELEKDLEGLLHVSEINLAPGARMEDVYKVEDKINVEIIHIDGVQKKIALTNKDAVPEAAIETPAEEIKPEAEATEEAKAEEAVAPKEDEKKEEAPAEETAPKEEEKIEEAPAEEAAPKEEEKTEEAPAEEAAPKEEEKKEEAPVEEAAPSEETKEEAPEGEATEETKE